VLIGGIAATLYGSRHVTDDTDILVRRTIANLNRVRRALVELDARDLRKRSLDEVVSPTFVLVRQYPGRLELVHADLYRVDRREEVEALSLLELSAAGVLAVEWADRAPWLATTSTTNLHLGPGDTEGSRELELDGGPPRFHDALLGGARRSP
jgi:tRNA A37 threonylcarbamoyladenosine biosynthesis protein TsaE